MSPLFLDPGKPLSTCEKKSCEGCDVSDTLVCHFNGKQLGIFLSMFVPIGIIAGYIFYTTSPWLLAGWVLFMVAYFGFIEIRVMCSHCPHYAEPGTKSLQCWANYGSPKLWKFRPGPMSITEKTVFLAGLVLIFLSPIAVLVLQKSYVLLAVYTAIIIGWKTALKAFYCSHCINFACPLNAVEEDTRQKFLEKNPPVGKAWTRPSTPGQK